MSLSIIIPYRNEENVIENTIRKINQKIKNKINNYEYILVNDFSSDDTEIVCKQIIKKYKNIVLKNNNKIGLGGAINIGVRSSKKKNILIVMADLSDDPNDIVRYYKLITKLNLDAVFGSRFIKKSKVIDYPIRKLIFNRIFNLIVKFLFLSNYNDFTNAFKIYKRKTLIDMLPFVSENFNIFLELPLKIIIRKKNYKIININWKNRKKGKSKFKIKELSSKYIFTLLYCFFEKILLR